MRSLSLGLVLLLFLAVCTSKEAKVLTELEVCQAKLAAFKERIARLQSSLENSQGELELAKYNIERVKQFQLLRTDEEREEQLRDALSKKLRIEDIIEDTHRRLLAYADSVSSTEHKILKISGALKN